MRRKIVAGNWKLNKTVEEAKVLAKEVADLAAAELPEGVELVVCPPAVNMYPVQEVIADSKVALGAQNCYTKQNGAFTGETAPDMIKSVGGEYVIIGHSERREYFGENDEFVGDKVKLILETAIYNYMGFSHTKSCKNLNKYCICEYFFHHYMAQLVHNCYVCEQNIYLKHRIYAPL